VDVHDVRPVPDVPVRSSRARWALAFCWSGPAVLNVLDEHRVGVVIPIYAVTAAAWLLVSTAAIANGRAAWAAASLSAETRDRVQ
jgi:hypothetical protein